MLNQVFSAIVCKRKAKTTLNPSKKKFQAECPICKSPLIKTSITKCGHAFCEYCIDEHFSYNQSCPICRADLAGSYLYPLKALSLFPVCKRRVPNGIKCAYEGMSLKVKDNLGRWWPAIVKVVVPNGDDFPLLLISYKNTDIIELIPQDSERFACCKTLKEGDDKKV
ncbi:hypothetical protein SteCoe_37312 [Stentor coeruleus]|uniref:RING-type domain-containing protein n=1 Tax=Stentor coeruleus TaxID=5963 RepID=A0A1R2AND4_9CILI|nr:hypothetical protein SteCoe_37312 [Stentor coeruleus]